MLRASTACTSRWVSEACYGLISSYLTLRHSRSTKAFDRLDRAKLSEMVQFRVADRSLLRPIGKCLHVGVLDGAEYCEPERGTTEGSVLLPLLGVAGANKTPLFGEQHDGG